MPLNKGCSKAAADANYSQLYKDGYRNPQLSAIVRSTLTKACGVDRDTTMTNSEIIAAGTKERRWIDLADLFEELPSSPAVRGLSFGVPSCMRGVGVSPSASPPSDSRGLVGRLGNEATNLANGMRMQPLVGGHRCRGCGTPAKRGGKCPRCGMEA